MVYQSTISCIEARWQLLSRFNFWSVHTSSILAPVEMGWRSSPRICKECLYPRPYLKQERDQPSHPSFWRLDTFPCTPARAPPQPSSHAVRRLLLFYPTVGYNFFTILVADTFVSLLTSNAPTKTMFPFQMFIQGSNSMKNCVLLFASKRCSPEKTWQSCSIHIIIKPTAFVVKVVVGIVPDVLVHDYWAGA